MTARRLHHAELWRTPWLCSNHILEYLFHKFAVACSPLSRFVGNRKIRVGNNVPEAAADQQSLHIGEIYITAVIITGFISRSAEFTSQRRKLLHLVDEFEYGSRRLARQSVEYCRQRTVGTKTRGIEIAENYPGIRDTVEAHRNAVAIERGHKMSRKTFKNYQIYIGALSVQYRRMGRVGSCRRLNRQIPAHFIIRHESVLAGIAVGMRGRI